MKRGVKDWLLILASLADDVAVVVLIFIILQLLRIPITWPLIALLIAIFGGSVFLIHKLIIPILHRKKINGAEGMVGLKGKVVESISPSGLIKAEGEYWKAKSSCGHITTGEKVEIIGFVGLTLIVKPLK